MRNYQQEKFQEQYQQETQLWWAEQEYLEFAKQLQHLDMNQAKRVAMILLAAQDFIQFGSANRKQYLNEALQGWDEDMSITMPENYRVV